MDDLTLIEVKHLIEGLALKFDVKIPIETEKDGKLKLGSQKEHQGDDTKNQTSLKGDTTPIALSNYDGLIGFMNAIAGLPYLLEYDQGCIGKKCNGGIEMAITVKKVNI